MRKSKRWLLGLMLFFSMLIATIPVTTTLNLTPVEGRGPVISEVFEGVPTATDYDVAHQAKKGQPQHWAIIIGISDYKAIGDLRFCDEDANDWYNYLSSIGYEHIIVLGDHTSDYLQYDGLATEWNVKQTLLDVVTSAGERDTIALLSSGHGSGDSHGTSLLCMWDLGMGENGEDGRLWDYELAPILELAVAANIFVFLDHCLSGGFGDDLLAMSNAENVYLTTTCDEHGMGWDEPLYNNGLWTYFFLEYTLIDAFSSDPDTEMEAAFLHAEAAYPYERGAMHPQQYDGDPDSPFFLW
ncbi:MAG: caspase family protein [Candidatus Hodarchaeota archaeon]